MTPEPRTPPRAALVALLMGVVLRLAVGLDPFPYWNDDPTTQTAALVGYGPAISLTLDAVMLAASAVILWFFRAGRPVAFLLFAGAAAGVWHSWGRDGVRVEHAILASGWTAAITAGLALHAASRSAPDRARIIAVLAGVVAMLALKGGVQFMIEQPESVRAFEANKSTILQSRGWPEGSPMALAFERRLKQQEATGWFALSNVYGSVGAGLLVMLLALLVRGAGRHVVLRALGVALAAGMLFFSQSKGAVVAAGVGVVLLAVAGIAPAWLRERAGLVGVFIAPAVLATVVVRGLLGERLGELSLLFRWFYVQGAARVFAEHPLIGVGPAGFQHAFMLAKPALCPESPASPHSLFIEYACALGVFAFGWIVLLFAASREFSRRLLEPAAPVPPAPRSTRPPFREEIRLVVLVLTLPSLLGAVLEMEAADVVSTLVRFGGIALGGVVGAGVLLARDVDGRRGSISLATAALALLAHAQIELTPVNLGAAAWFMAVLGVAAARPGDRPARASRAAAAGSTLLALAAVVAASRAWVWESRLHRAYEIVAPLQGDHAQLAQARAGDKSAAGSLYESLYTRTGRRVPFTPDGIEHAAAAERLSRIRQAQAVLASACRAVPSSFLTSRALSSLMLAEFDASSRLGRVSNALDRAERTTAEFVQRHPSPLAWAWLGVIRRNQAEAENNPERLRQAAVAYEHAAALDPRGLDHAVRLAGLYRQLGDTTKAGAWAERALRIDNDLRLDPLVGLNEAKRREMEGLARGGG